MSQCHCEHTSELLCLHSTLGQAISNGGRCCLAATNKKLLVCSQSTNKKTSIETLSTACRQQAVLGVINKHSQPGLNPCSTCSSISWCRKSTQLYFANTFDRLIVFLLTMLAKCNSKSAHGSMPCLMLAQSTVDSHWLSAFTAASVAFIWAVSCKACGPPQHLFRVFAWDLIPKAALPNVDGVVAPDGLALMYDISHKYLPESA